MLEDEIVFVPDMPSKRVFKVIQYTVSVYHQNVTNFVYLNGYRSNSNYEVPEVYPTIPEIPKDLSPKQATRIPSPLA